MITLISSTNRSDSYTRKVAQYYLERLEVHTTEKVLHLDLQDIPLIYYENAQYSPEGQETALSDIQDTYIVPAEKFIFLVPEYNGGFPGVLKLFIDAISIRKYTASFHGKKACLTGISSGRAGNLRGMEHLTGILNYLQVVIYPNRLPISRIKEVFDEEGIMRDTDTLDALEKQIRGFLQF